MRSGRRYCSNMATQSWSHHQEPATRSPIHSPGLFAQIPSERLAICVDVLKAGRTPAALVATASVCIEVNDFEAARRDLDEAIAQAPYWAAAHYERGKLWLRADDMAKASESFRSAALLLPGFGPTWANLGATLGELDRPRKPSPPSNGPSPSTRRARRP